jgi:hypothetical protein
MSILNKQMVQQEEFKGQTPTELNKQFPQLSIDQAQCVQNFYSIHDHVFLPNASEIKIQSCDAKLLHNFCLKTTSAYCQSVKLMLACRPS